MNINNFNPLFNKIRRETAKAENFNTGLVGESIIVGAYKTMPLDKLIKLRYIINKIIDQKRKAKYCAEANEKKAHNISVS